MGTVLTSRVGSVQNLIWGKAPNEDPAVLLCKEEQVGVQILSIKKSSNASPKSQVTSLTTWCAIGVPLSSPPIKEGEICTFGS